MENQYKLMYIRIYIKNSYIFLLRTLGFIGVIILLSRGVEKMGEEKKSCIRKDIVMTKYFYENSEENSFTRKTDFFLGHGGNLFLFLLYLAISM